MHWQTEFCFTPACFLSPPLFVAELEMAFGRRSPGISVAVSQSPFAAGLALIMEPPVLPVCLDEKEALCGPLYLPGKSVCPECLGHWLDMNLHGRADPNALSAPKRRARWPAEWRRGRRLSRGMGGWRNWKPRPCPSTFATRQAAGTRCSRAAIARAARACR